MPTFLDRLSASCLLAFACLLTSPVQAASTTAVACGDIFGDCVRQDGLDLARATHSGDRDYGRSFTAMAEAALGALRAEVRASSEDGDGGGQWPRAAADFSDVIHFAAPADVHEIELTVSITLDGYCKESCVAQLGATLGRGVKGATLNLYQAFPATQSATLLWDVRETLPVSSFLDVRCRSTWGRDCVADFAHTGTLTVTPALSTVTAIGETGHNYAVPEPQGWLMGLAGIGMLGAGRCLRGISLRGAGQGRG